MTDNTPPQKDQMVNRKSVTDQCSCDSGQTYAACCGVFHQDPTKITAPEQLMRSRYCALVKKNIDYLINTEDLGKDPETARREWTKSSLNTHWLGLRILKSDQKQVEFMAFYSNPEQSKPQALHELSTFSHQNGQWRYVKGKLFNTPQPKRNDACWCGSGKKAKKCCFQ